MLQMLFKDQLNRNITLNSKPRRIISLVPSQTELLHFLGLDTEVIGITKFCVHPKSWFLNKTRVGGTKKLDIEKIKLLQPDLVIGNKEENLKEQIEEIEKFAPVWVSDVSNLDDALEMIAGIAKLIDRSEKAAKLILDIQNEFRNLEEKVSAVTSPKTVLYFIWHDPYYCAGTDTFISEMIRRCGLKNAIDMHRYPELTNMQIAQISPDYIFLSSEPFPFKEKHITEMKAIAPHSKIILVDGEMFSWYGSRLRLSPKYFINLVSTLH
jgi:ABC-type Fe3+-hydroxamate transport system substrate-binding protein